MKERGSKQWPSSCININMQDMKSKWQKEHGNDDDDDNDNDNDMCGPL
mgnify:CR=1 FL=1